MIEPVPKPLEESFVSFALVGAAVALPEEEVDEPGTVTVTPLLSVITTNGGWLSDAVVGDVWGVLVVDAEDGVVEVPEVVGVVDGVEDGDEEDVVESVLEVVAEEDDAGGVRVGGGGIRGVVSRG